MAEQLTLEQEREIWRFKGLLRHIVGVDDMFPPDDGIRELRLVPPPVMPPGEEELWHAVIRRCAEPEPALLVA